MNKRISIIFLLISLLCLSSVQAQEEQKNPKQLNPKFQTALDIDLSYPNVFGISLTQRFKLKDNRIYLGIGTNIIALKPSESISLDYIKHPSSELRCGGMSSTELSRDNYLTAFSIYSNFRFLPPTEYFGKDFQPYTEVRLGTVLSSFRANDDILSHNLHGYGRLGLGFVYRKNSLSKLALDFGLHIEYFSPAFSQNMKTKESVKVYNDGKDFKHKVKPFNVGFNIGLLF